MKLTNTNKTRTLTYAALFSALIFLTTAYLFHLPAPNGGYVHLGDAFIYLAACILPKPYAAAAASIGAGLSDLVSPGGAVWVLPTVIIKSLMVIPFKKQGKFMTKSNFIASVISGIGSTALYLIAEMLMFGNPLAVLATIPHGLIQPVGSTILFVFVAIALDKTKLNEKLLVK